MFVIYQKVGWTVVPPVPIIVTPLHAVKVLRCFSETSASCRRGTTGSTCQLIFIQLMIVMLFAVSMIVSKIVPFFFFSPSLSKNSPWLNFQDTATADHFFLISYCTNYIRTNIHVPKTIFFLHFIKKNVKTAKKAPGLKNPLGPSG